MQDPFIPPAPYCFFASRNSLLPNIDLASRNTFMSKKLSKHIFRPLSWSFWSLSQISRHPKECVLTLAERNMKGPKTLWGPQKIWTLGIQISHMFLDTRKQRNKTWQYKYAPNWKGNGADNKKGHTWGKVWVAVYQACLHHACKLDICNVNVLTSLSTALHKHFKAEL